MPLNPEMRASDADRDRVATALREHCAQGRISMDELHERLDATYAAKTLGALHDVTADLPEMDLYDLPVPATRRAGMAPVHGRGVGLHNAALSGWAGYASVNLMLVIIWVISCVASAELLFPWWIWVAGPWGAVLATRTIFGPRHH
ncbi:MAG: hypothetical protein JWO67_485 [Streptosporangiaceae bacterium]|nr:hypothetical protein [Streptosporangiaceae bacterium]